jgi:hypothetical protein
LRERGRVDPITRQRLLRTPLLPQLAGDGTFVTLTREQPPGWDGRTGRVDRELVEGVADALVALGHDASRIRTERCGPT